MIEVVRTVHTKTPIERVEPWLADFTTSQEWDPHTVTCERVDSGELRVGSEFDNTQQIGPMKTTLRYRVESRQPGSKIVLVSKSRLMTATDTMTFQTAGDGGTSVTYSARFELNGPAKLGEPGLKKMMDKVADEGAAGMQRCLDAL